MTEHRMSVLATGGSAQMRGFATGVGSKASVGAGAGRAPHVREPLRILGMIARVEGLFSPIPRAPARAPRIVKPRKGPLTVGYIAPAPPQWWALPWRSARWTGRTAKSGCSGGTRTTGSRASENGFSARRNVDWSARCPSPGSNAGARKACRGRRPRAPWRARSWNGRAR